MAAHWTSERTNEPNERTERIVGVVSFDMMKKL